LLGNAARATRVAHLRYFRLPGSEAAVREPRRVALALLWELVGEAALHRDDLEPVRSFAPNERQLLAHMLRHNLNAPSTSSAGRLFDGIAALIGLRQHVSFEGQAAILLEHIADTTTRTAYPLDIRHLPRPDAPDASTTHGPLIEVDWRPLVAAILDDLQQGTLQAIMAAKFHNALVESMLRVAQSIGEPRIALSGGCFQNRLLTERAIQRLGNAGFKLLLHRQVPPNDGGISLGQVVVAAAKLQQL
jgi:hydrogenase maturation protein HypF